MMPYSANGHRIKEQGARYVHTDFNLPTEWKKNECLFGEHLLREAKEGVTIAIVESEKTACLMSEFMPEYIWMACGGSNGLTAEKMSGIKDWTIIIFSDADAYGEWKQKAEAYREAGMRIAVSDFIEKQATPEQKARKVDIADLFLEAYNETHSYRQQPQQEAPELAPVAITETDKAKQASGKVAANGFLVFDDIKDLCNFVFEWQQRGTPPDIEQLSSKTGADKLYTDNNRRQAQPNQTQPLCNIIPDEYFFFDNPQEMYYYTKEWKRVMSLPVG